MIFPSSTHPQYHSSALILKTVLFLKQNLPNLPKKYVYSIMFWQTWKKVKSTLEVLKEFGGDINQRCHSGFIPIQEAVLNRSDPAAVVSAL